MSLRSSLPRLAAAVAVAGLAVLSTGVGTAHAAYSSCPSGYNCFFNDLNGSGYRWQFAGDNTDLMWKNIFSMSGYNNGTSGMRACGYQNVNYAGLNYSREKGDTQSFSMRPIRSMRWKWAC